MTYINFYLGGLGFNFWLSVAWSLLPSAESLFSGMTYFKGSFFFAFIDSSGSFLIGLNSFFVNWLVEF